MKKLCCFLIAFSLFFSVSFSIGTAESELEHIEFVTSLIELCFQEIDCEYTIDGNKSGFLIQFSTKELSFMFLMSMLLDDKETDASADAVVSSLIDLYQSLLANIEMEGIANPNITIMLTDHDEKDFIFVIICNGQIVYNILED